MLKVKDIFQHAAYRQTTNTSSQFRSAASVRILEQLSFEASAAAFKTKLQGWFRRRAPIVHSVWREGFLFAVVSCISSNAGFTKSFYPWW